MSDVLPLSLDRRGSAGSIRNTVAKAYRELEHPFVPAHARAKKLTDRVRAGQAIVAAAVERLRSRGITEAERRCAG